ncbi:CRISPR-associated protein [Cylindrospermopsis raciborskii Cr2010]|uniref:CRISPR-associated protein n=1 Tax=Cylindrospermopsis raciborskii TaxID=77022 RepID=UPI000E1F25C2|nr:CRISPR-associated protein [Cylindrospermopsis raciborskii]UJL32321.1 CRISPR-associated protein [Cylindrospermopsis raciborskii Cr2010]
MYKYLIIINPLGFLYGSAGAFLSSENLIGRSGSKFPPDAYTLSGLFFAANKTNPFIEHEELKKLHLAGPFWSKPDQPHRFYIPIPWTKIINQKSNKSDEWEIKNDKWYRDQKSLEPDCKWHDIHYWRYNRVKDIMNQSKGDPWRYVSILHPRLLKNERCVEESGLFLENAIQNDQEFCLVYLSTHEIPKGWYCFGGEGHLVEIESQDLSNHVILGLLKEKIQRSFALITPGVWGSNRFSRRYPDPNQTTFPKPSHILTDRPSPYRYRVGDNKGGGRLGRGRYAVPAGSVYVFEEPLNKSWWGDENEAGFPNEWFPTEGFSLKQLGCGLCLPIKIKGVE